MNSIREIQNMLDTIVLREWEIEGKTLEQIDRIKDRWAIEDAAENIASAIRSKSNNIDFLWF